MRLWNDERDLRLARLYGDGGSAAQVAVVLSAEWKVDMTRNAVIGRLHRLGITDRTNAKMMAALGKEKFWANAEGRPESSRKKMKQQISEGQPERCVAPASLPSISAAPTTPLTEKQIEALDRRHAAGKAAKSRGMMKQPPVPVLETKCETPAQEPATSDVLNVGAPRAVLELRDYLCRWPLGEPSSPAFRFCCARKARADRPYCAMHESIASGRGTPSERASHRVPTSAR